MNPLRRQALQAALLAWAAPGRAAGPDTIDDTVAPGRALQFPRDHGAHTGTRTEWWYATGWLAGDAGALIGYQITFFRSRTGLGDGLPGRFVPRQLLMGHAALTDVQTGQHHHAQRLARWSGDEANPEAHALRSDAGVVLGPWQFRRLASGSYEAKVVAPDAGFNLTLTLQPTQALLLQGEAGWSRKGPLPDQASHYTTEPQLMAAAQLTRQGRTQTLRGQGWLDHEWSNQLLASDVVGWDWLGINLADGGALTAFVLRRADGSRVWAGGSHRPAQGSTRAFAPDEVQWQPEREWTSPATGARYPVVWRITTPAGSHRLRALVDAQEMDARSSTGTVYWEGLSELLDARGARVGLGYLEMTGRLKALQLPG